MDSSKIDLVGELVDNFSYNIKQYKNVKYDEANTRVDFIDKFFEILDWDVRNVQGFSEIYRDVVREDKHLFIKYTKRNTDSISLEILKDRFLSGRYYNLK